MAALGRIMAAVRAHSVNGVCGDVDPGRCLPAFRCVQSLSGRAPSPARSGMWHLLGDAGCPLWPFVASGPSCCFALVTIRTFSFPSSSPLTLVPLPQKVLPIVDKEKAI